MTWFLDCETGIWLLRCSMIVKKKGSQSTDIWRLSWRLISILTSLLHLIGRFSNDDGDGNENPQKAMSNNFARASRFFVYFFAVTGCTTAMWKSLMSLFVEDVDKRRRIFLSFCSLNWGSPQEINSRQIRLHLTFSANWNKRNKVWTDANLFLKWRPRCCCPRPC